MRVTPAEKVMGAGSSGIVFGFGAVTEADLAHGLGLIAAASRVHA